MPVDRGDVSNWSDDEFIDEETDVSKATVIDVSSALLENGFTVSPEAVESPEITSDVSSEYVEGCSSVQPSTVVEDDEFDDFVEAESGPFVSSDPVQVEDEKFDEDDDFGNFEGADEPGHTGIPSFSSSEPV